MTTLTKAVNEFSKLDNSVVGCEGLGIVIVKGDSYHALNLADALTAIDAGVNAMEDSLENKTTNLGSDFEF